VGETETDQQTHNRGNKEDRREALASSVNLARLLLTVAAGTFVLSGSLLNTLYVGRSLTLLELGWAALGLSLVFGFLVHGQYISQLAESELVVRQGALEIFSALQAIAVGVGLLLFGLFVLANVSAGPQIEIDRARVKSPEHAVLVSIDCRAGTGNGCQGEVTLRKPHLPGRIGRAVFSEKKDGPAEVKIPLPARGGREGRRQISKRVEVIVFARGRFGNSSTESKVLVVRHRVKMKRWRKSAPQRLKRQR
jgi:hypothetical protein